MGLRSPLGLCSDMALWMPALAIFLALSPLLCAQELPPSSPSSQEGAKSPEKCQKPTGDSKLRFAPDKEYYVMEELVTLSCPEGYEPSQPKIQCLRNGSHSVWSEAATCQRRCQPPDPRDRQVEFTPKQPSYSPGDAVTWSCPEGYRPSVVKSTCTQSGNWSLWSVHCVGNCQVPDPRDAQAEFLPKQLSYSPGDVVTWSCSRGYGPSVVSSRCTQWGNWSPRSVQCVRKCMRPITYSLLSFNPDKPYYDRGDLVTVSCPWQYVPKPSEIQCLWKGNHSVWSEAATCQRTCDTPRTWDSDATFTPYQWLYSSGDVVTWNCPKGYRSSAVKSTCVWGNWIPESIHCIGFCTISEDLVQFVSRYDYQQKCHRPIWDPSLQFSPDQLFYGKNEEVRLSCLDGSPPSLPVIRCARQYQDKQDVWAVRDGESSWRQVEKNVTCAGHPQIIPGASEISPTSIRLSWACTPSKSCQGTWSIGAQCLPVPAELQANPCPRQASSREQILEGQAGTLICSALQPFTLYNVTISASYSGAVAFPSTVLYTWLVRTNETVPAQPQIEPRDPSTGSLRWKQPPSCHGDILGYQLNITVQRENDSRFFEEQVVRVNPSVTEYRLPFWRPGTNYTVTVQGLTAAGLGEASQWTFETEISGKLESRQAGLMPRYMAMAMAMSVLVVLAAGPLLLWVMLRRWCRASASSTGQEHSADQQLQNLSVVYWQMPLIPGGARRDISDSDLQA
ncbi:beta-2-glycoprotein 1-like [Alligator mississippiensis]|uniref:Beta-2-glycoprotein 1-like n=1 Tax=Alligator mississippiensis TaxID=8496 RepID=A0A151NU77_ALLMI|nr:beta-2-glycoprotein 1-like [Alligator mississippiensis]